MGAVTGENTIEVVLRDPKFGIEAYELESNGQILVLSGSRARGENTSEVDTCAQLRRLLLETGKLVRTDNPRIMEFREDVLFDSPSAAAAVILDRNDNGRASWKERHSSKTLNQWYAEQASRATQGFAAELG